MEVPFTEPEFIEPQLTETQMVPHPETSQPDVVPQDPEPESQPLVQSNHETEPQGEVGVRQEGTQAVETRQVDPDYVDYLYKELQGLRSLYDSLKSLVDTHSNALKDEMQVSKRTRKSLHKLEEDVGTQMSIFEEFDRVYTEDKKETMRRLQELQRDASDPSSRKRKQNLQELEYLEKELSKFK